MAHNAIYEKLTADPNDLAGAFAYIMYKQQKIDFSRSFPGRSPTKEELDGFHAIAMLDSSIAGYRSQGEAMAQTFLNASLDEVVERAEIDTRQDTLYKYIGTINSGLESRLIALHGALDAKRTILGWVRDIGGNLLVNLVTIYVIGSLLFGYKFLGELQQSLEDKAGVGGSNAEAIKKPNG